MIRSPLTASDPGGRATCLPCGGPPFATEIWPGLINTEQANAHVVAAGFGWSNRT